MTVSLGSIEFDRISYDREADTLYLGIEGTDAAHWEESPEGHVLRFDASGDLCGITIIGVQHQLGAEGAITVTVTRTVAEEIGPEDLEPALALA
jgi:uncharacterized protein YuzE